MKRQDDLFFSYRRLNLIGFMLSGSALSYAYVELEQALGGIHCTLCTLMRLALLCMSVVFLLAFFHNPWISGQRFYAVFNSLFSLLGLTAAGRYVWLEANPAQLETGCTLGLGDLVSYLPQTLQGLLTGPSDCLKQTQTASGISLSYFALALFIILFVVSWRLLIRRPTPRLFF